MGNDLMARAKEDNVRFVSLQFTDILGATKSVTVPLDQLPRALNEGIWFDGDRKSVV